MWKFLFGLIVGLLIGSGALPVHKHLREVSHLVAEGVR
jgi:hypothetical protein